MRSLLIVILGFNTQSRGGGCDVTSIDKAIQLMFQHTVARRRLQKSGDHKMQPSCFNTQSRGGGCPCSIVCSSLSSRFNTQSRGGGCVLHPMRFYRQNVSTHSRAEAAASRNAGIGNGTGVSTHSRAEAAALHRPKVGRLINRFNTQPR